MKEIKVEIKYEKGDRLYKLYSLDDNNVDIVTIEGFRAIEIENNIPKVYYHTTNGCYEQDELFESKEAVLNALDIKYQKETKKARKFLIENPLNK